MKQIKHQIFHELTNCQSKKLRGRMLRFMRRISLQSANLKLRNRVDEFYYRQKNQEIEVLEEKLHDSTRQAMMYLNLLEATCSDVAAHLKSDMETLRRHSELRKN